MTGPSGLAYDQWMGASLGNPYMSTIVPYVSPDDHWDNTFPNAAFHLTVNMHTVAILGGSRTNRSGLETAFWDWEKLVWHLPLRTMDEAMLGKSVQVWQDFMDHLGNDDYWPLGVGDLPRSGEMGPGRYRHVRVPTLSIAGWYDQVQQATINGYPGMKRYGPPNTGNRFGEDTGDADDSPRKSPSLLRYFARGSLIARQQSRHNFFEKSPAYFFETPWCTV